VLTPLSTRQLVNVCRRLQRDPSLRCLSDVLHRTCLVPFMPLAVREVWDRMLVQCGIPAVDPSLDAAQGAGATLLSGRAVIAAYITPLVPHVGLPYMYMLALSCAFWPCLAHAGLAHMLLWLSRTSCALWY
jgi:hypothetical protein